MAAIKVSIIMSQIQNAPSGEMELYQQDWVGESLEIWLDAVEDLGVFEMNSRDKIVFGRKKGIATCIS